MKYLVITAMLLIRMNLVGQGIHYQVREFNEVPKEILNNLDKMGIDSSAILNKYESAFLNVIFKSKLDGFDFTNKKIGFLLGVSKRNKKEYFEETRVRYSNNHSIISSALYIFNEKQKLESGGYDAAIVYWSKFVIPIDKIVQKLANKPKVKY